ncbi:hypothetical protein DVH05_007165 [Phytophthora capsici]|nr:hypothetical protein DVH05_007165 [Phytophthora capsici]
MSIENSSQQYHFQISSSSLAPILNPTERQMKLCHIVLAVALLVAYADPASASKEWKLATHENNIPTKRLLRAYTMGGEERGIAVNLGLEKISNVLTSGKTKEFQKLVKAGQSSDDSFVNLGLGQVLNFGKKVR